MLLQAATTAVNDMDHEAHRGDASLDLAKYVWDCICSVFGIPKKHSKALPEDTVPTELTQIDKQLETAMTKIQLIMLVQKQQARKRIKRKPEVPPTVLVDEPDLDGLLEDTNELLSDAPQRSRSRRSKRKSRRRSGSPISKADKEKQRRRHEVRQYVQGELSRMIASGRTLYGVRIDSFEERMKVADADGKDKLSRQNWHDIIWRWDIVITTEAFGIFFESLDEKKKK